MKAPTIYAIYKGKRYDDILEATNNAFKDGLSEIVKRHIARVTKAVEKFRAEAEKEGGSIEITMTDELTFTVTMHDLSKELSKKIKTAVGIQTD